MSVVLDVFPICERGDHESCPGRAPEGPTCICDCHYEKRPTTMLGYLIGFGRRADGESTP